MKRALLLSIFLLCASFLFAQYPAKQTLGSDSTLVQSKGALKGRLINWSYPDTASANLERISQYPGAQITVDDLVYFRNNDATKWILLGSNSTAINNGLLSTGGITLIDSSVTIQDTIRWSYNGIIYTKTTPSSFVINSADSGYYRRDLIYADTSGLLYKVAGLEDTSIALVPDLPDNSVVVTIVDVYGNQIAPPFADSIGAIPNLQQVTNQGNSTTNPIFINSNSIQTPLRITSDFNRSNYLYFKNRSNGGWANTGFLFKNDVPDDPNNEHTGHFLQLYMGSTNSAFSTDGGLIRSNGTGGIKVALDSGKFVLGTGSPSTGNYISRFEMGTDGNLSFLNYKNNVSEDSVLSTDETGKVILKKIVVPDISGKVNYTDSVSKYVTPTQLAALHNNLNLYWPLYGDNADTSVHFKNDSLPRLDYATAVRDTSEWNDNTLIDKLFLHDRLAEVTATGITRTELQDTASAIRSSMGSGSVQSVTGSPSGLVDNTDPANPVIQQDASKVNISDTAAMLSHYLLDAIAGTNVTIDKTNPQKPVINSSGGKDSSAYHTVQSIGDTALVICDLQGRCDTTFFSAHTVWSKNGNYAYYNDGNVGIKDMTPPSLLTLTNATTNNTPEDSLGVLLRTSTDATSGNPTVSLPIILAAKAWITASSQSQNIKFKMYAWGSNGTATGNMYIDFSGNDGAYSHIVTLTQGGNLTTNALSTGVVTGTAFSGNSFTVSRNVNNGSSFTDNSTFVTPSSLTTYRSFYYNPTWTTSSIVGIDVRAFDNTIGNNVFNRVRGSTSIGSDSVVTGAKLAVTSTTSAFLLPRMTKVQRDSIYSGFTGSITNPGTGGTAVNSTYLRALTGGSGTGAEAAITIVSNQVTAVTITKYGSGYAVGDVLTAAVGGIIGWTWTISFIIPPKAGSVIYQTDNTPGIRVFNGTNWMKFTETAD